MVWLLPRLLLTILSLATGGLLGHLAGAPFGLPNAGAMLGAILAAVDATAEVKSDASVQRLMLTAEEVGDKKLKLDDWE